MENGGQAFFPRDKFWPIRRILRKTEPEKQTTFDQRSPKKNLKKNVQDGGHI